MNKKLYKSTTDKKSAGVCGGIAEYFGVDSVWIRLAWVLIALCMGTGLIAYIVCALIIPNKPPEAFVPAAPPSENIIRCEQCGAEINVSAIYTEDIVCPVCGHTFKKPV